MSGPNAEQFPVVPQGMPLNFAAEPLTGPAGNPMCRLHFVQGQLKLNVDLDSGDAEQIAKGIMQVARQSRLGLIIPNGNTPLQ